MPVRLRLLCFIITFILSFQAFAANPQASLSCLRLGSKPSLIVKFRGFSSKTSPGLSSRFMKTLQSSYATFTTVRPMSGDAYVIYFTPTNTLKSHEQSPGCYSKAAIDDLILELKRRGDVEYVDPNILMDFTAFKPNARTLPIIDPLQWDMLTPPAEPGGMDVENAFTISMGQPGVVTAVLDSGILNNDALNPNLLDGVTFNNGYRGEGAIPSCDSSCSGYDHGTHVAGTVASSGELAYTKQIYGVAPSTRVLPINVFSKVNPDKLLVTLESDVVDALYWVGGRHFDDIHDAPAVNVVNMSLGGIADCPNSLKLAFQNLKNKNISIFVAAGNDNIDVKHATPANCPDVITVAASNRSGYGASYSNYGDNISFAAPGGEMSNETDPNGILSTSDADNTDPGYPRYYRYYKGTSMASPHAAGLAALMNSIDPTLTPDDIKRIMKDTARDFTQGGPGNSCTIGRPCGNGILNAYKAMQETSDHKPVITWPPSPITVQMNSATQVTVTWQAAYWQPSRTMGILYTVNLDGNDVGTCSLMSTRSCVLTGLVPDSFHTVKIKAVDNKQILTPVETGDQNFQLLLVPPTLTSAVRDPLKYRIVYVHYNPLGSPLPPDSYELNGAPVGVTLTLDAANSRFILGNVVTLDQVNDVSISSVYGAVIKTSNTVSLPSVTISPPTLVVAERNPLKLTQVYLYYSQLGGPPPDFYSVYGVPAGATVSLDAGHQRFVLDNIISPKKMDYVYLTSTYGAVTTESNFVTIPSIL